jgi:hypothetical protein
MSCVGIWPGDVFHVNAGIVPWIKPHPDYSASCICRAGLATDDKLAQPHCMLGTLGYIYTLKACHTCCFSTATVVARTRLNITLYVRRLSCFFENCCWLRCCTSQLELLLVACCQLLRTINSTDKHDAKFAVFCSNGMSCVGPLLYVFLA